MRSIPAAMTWEIFRHGGWKLALATLSAIALPILILMALRGDGALDPKDQSMLIMHIVIANNCMLAIGAALFSSPGRISRLYTYPLRTSSIVASRLLPAMVIMVALVAICLATLNLLFNLGWPIWGPALTAGVALAIANAFAWLTDKSPMWLAVAMASAGGAIGFWFKSRYGSAVGEPTRYWNSVTPADAFTLLAASAFAYWVAVKAVARNRRGEPPISLGLVAWLDRVFDQWPLLGAEPNTAFQAHCWFQWRHRGWILPAGTWFILFLGMIVWLFSDRAAEKLVEGFFFGGFMLTWLGFIAGLLFGNIGPNDSSYEMGNFLATRPTTDTDTARAILLTAAKSVAIAWAIWAVAFALVCGCLAATGSAEAIKFPGKMSWWYFPITFVGPWIVTSSLTCVGLFGRLKFVAQILCGIIATVIIAALFSRFALKSESRALVAEAITALFVSSLVIATALALVAARRRGLLQSLTTWVTVCIWVGTTVLLAYLCPANFEPRIYAYLYVAAFATLLVMPVAAAPLAISMNRHR